MARDEIGLCIKVDRQTDAILREWAKRSERSKRSLAKMIVRRRARRWQERKDKPQ